MLNEKDQQNNQIFYKSKKNSLLKNLLGKKSLGYNKSFGYNRISIMLRK